MPIDPDDDLFDSPAPVKRSNKIVHQPAGASWSLDRLPEIQDYYQRSFKKPLPLTNKGQGSIHNRLGYDHRNSADISVHPSSKEGQQLIAEMQRAGIPFLAFTEAIPGVSTGPHIHAGFPSSRSKQKFNVGAQRRKQSVASDDLFDADSDLFDQVQGQTPPPSQKARNVNLSRQPSPTPPVVQKAQSVPASRLSQLSVGGVQGRTSSVGVGDLRRIDDPATQQINRIQRAVTSEQSPIERQTKRAPGAANARLLEPKLTENEEVLRRLEEEQSLAKREQEAAKERQRLARQFTASDKAEIADFVNHLKGKGTTYTGIRTGARSVGASTLYKLAGLTDLVGPSQVYGGKPEDNPLGEFLRRKALAGELSVEDIPPEQRGQVAEFLTQMGLGLAEIAVTPGGPVTKFAGLAGTESIGRGQSAREVAKETAKGATIGQVFKSAGRMSRPAETVQGRAANLAKEGAAIGAGTYATEIGFGAPSEDAALSAATNVALHGALGAKRLRGQRNVETPDRANEVVRPARATVEEAVPPTAEGVGGRPPELKRFQHIQFGEVEVVSDQSGARPGRLKVAEVADPSKQHFVKKSDMQGRGNARMIPLKPEGEAGTELSAPPIESRMVDRPAIAGEEVARESNPVIEQAFADWRSQRSYIDNAGNYRIKAEGRSNGPIAPWNKEVKRAFKNVKDFHDAAQVVQPKESVVATPQAGEIAKEGAVLGGSAAPNIPERPETIQAQLESRGYSLIPKDTQRPSLPQGYRAEKTPDGVVYYDPKRIDAETIRSTPTTELLGHVEPKSERTTEAVVARTLEGTELHASAVSPENLQKQVEVTKANFPEAKVEAGDARLAEKVIQERLEPSVTSARQESMAADRAELDLPELPQAERKSWQSTLDKAKEKGTQRASLLADEVLNKPRSLNEVETAQLVLRAQEVKNDHSRLMKEIGDEKNPESIASKRAEVEALEREFDKLTQATKASGTEKGRALAAQKLTINQDYDLVSLVSRAKAAKGRELTPEERVRYEGMAKEIETLTERLGKAEEQLASKQLQREIDRVVRRGKRAESKKELDDEFAMLATQFAQARAQSKGIHSAGLAGLDPEGIYTPLIAKMARNRVRAGVIKAEEVVDHVYDALEGNFSKRDIRDAISGYGLERKDKPRSEGVKELARIKSELKKLSAQEDIEAGKRLTPQEKTRQTNLLKQEANLQRRLEQRDFTKEKREPPQYTRETLAIQKRVERIKQEYNKELYKATRSTGGRISDELAKAANVPKTLKSIGDISAVFRQGGYYAITHPIEGGLKPTREMLKSFTDLGYRNVESAIKNDPVYDVLHKAGTEFTGIDKSDPRLSKREEGYLGGEYLDYVPVAKQVKDFSERTFVSFLDAQRLYMGKQMVEGLTPTQRANPAELKAIARLLNTGTGRGSLGRRGNALAPALNIAMFSPRLLASRVQLLNNMINPVTIARMPPGARARMIKDNVKFLAGTMAVIQLAKAAGATVSLDPDDSEFLKIRFGNTVYDQLTGLQQPLRYIINMTRAATGGETYAGKSMKEMTSPFEPGSFTRSKLNPALSPAVNFVTGSDYLGRKFSAKREVKDLTVPLPASDVIEAMQEEGLIGALKASPTFVGIGTGSYPPSPEKPKTHAEKLARKFVRARMPDNAREEEQIDIDQTKADLKAKSRRGDDVTKELEALGAKITSRQAKGILDARNKTRLQEDVNRLGTLDAIIVWSVMNPGQQQETRSILERKATLIDNLPIDQQENVRRRYQEAGIQAVARKPSTRATGFKKAFQRQFATAP